MKHTIDKYFWGVLRLMMGWTFLWAFLTNTFGLGFGVSSQKSWINGNSPTFGFLKFSTKGYFLDFYQSLAGNPIVDWVYMIGILLIGLALLLGIGVRIAGYFGTLFFVLIYTAANFPPERNPFLDQHVYYIVLLIGFTFVNAGDYLGLGGWWSKTKLVQRFPFLK
jgi:thiosulfate dehydrogenase [quinone] large subunit